MAQRTGQEKEVDMDDEKPVILVDELAEWEAEDPTFGGMREAARLERVYERLVERLRELYRERFRTSLPADDEQLFKEIVDEVVLPREAELRRLIAIVKRKERFSEGEEERLLDAAEEFLRTESQ